jgi:hypothetical protein
MVMMRSASAASDVSRVQPAPSAGDTNAPLSPSDKLQYFRSLKSLTDNSHGLAHVTKPDGSAVIAIASVDPAGVRNVVTVPTRLSAEQFEALKSDLLPLPETQLMLYELAVSYANRTPILLEGGTAIGKTFAVNTFAKMLYGPNAKIPDFYCNGQTDVSELMGKHVPAGLTPQQLEKLNTYIKSEAGELLRTQLKEENGRVDMKELMERAALDLGLPVQKGSFVFQLGVLPKAMTGTMSPEGIMLETHDGPGCMLHVQEVGMAAPSVVNAFLKIRGEKGKLAADIQVHEDGGRLVEAGEEFFLVFSTNPPGEGFLERFAVDSALSRALVWKRLPDELSADSLRLVAGRIFDFSKIERREDAPGAIVDLSGHQELAEVLGTVAFRFHRAFMDNLRKGEPGRKQKVPATIDSLWKVAELVQNHQVDGPAGQNRVDFVETIKQAIRSIYIDSLQSKPNRVPGESLEEAAKAKTSLGATLIAGLDALLSDSKLHGVPHEGKQVSPGEKILRLTPNFSAETETQKKVQGVARDRQHTVQGRVVLKVLEGLLTPEQLAGLSGQLDQGKNPSRNN